MEIWEITNLDGKSNVEIGEKIIQVGEWVYGGIAFYDNRVWIDTPYLGQIIVDKETVRTIYRTKR